MYATFFQRAYDQVVHDVATQNLPVTFCIDRGGLVAEDGTTHHGAFDYAYLRHMPNMVVMAPKDENELQHMLKTSVQYDGPSVGAVSAWGEPGRADGSRSRRPADRQGRVVARRHGRGDCRDRVPVWQAVRRRNGLRGRNVDSGGQCAFRETPGSGIDRRGGRSAFAIVVTVEEGCKMGGFGSAVLEALSEAGVTHVTTKVLGVAGLVHRARTAGLPARTIWIDGGRHLPEREGIDRQDTELPRERSSPLRHRPIGCRTEMNRGADET